MDYIEVTYKMPVEFKDNIDSLVFSELEKMTEDKVKAITPEKQAEIDTAVDAVRLENGLAPKDKDPFASKKPVDNLGVDEEVI